MEYVEENYILTDVADRNKIGEPNTNYRQDSQTIILSVHCQWQRIIIWIRTIFFLRTREGGHCQ